LCVACSVMSLPRSALAGFRKRGPEAVEAALKFFLVGTVSSAVMAYGLSFVYGTAATTALPGVARALEGRPPLLVFGLLAVLAGFGFKIAAFPFHMWVPDTYEAASTPFVAWLSVAPKAAGFVALFRVFLEGGGDQVPLWMPILAALAVARGRHAALPALARGDPVRRGLLGEALCPLGRRRGGPLLARAPRRHPDRRRPLLLPRDRPPHVHRPADPPGADPARAHDGALRHRVRPRRCRARPGAVAACSGGASGSLSALLGAPRSGRRGLFRLGFDRLSSPGIIPVPTGWYMALTTELKPAKEGRGTRAAIIAA